MLIVGIIVLILAATLIGFAWEYQYAKQDQACLDRNSEVTRELMVADYMAAYWQSRCEYTEAIEVQRDEEIERLRRTVKHLTRPMSRPNGANR